MNLIPRQILRQLLVDYGLTLLGESARVDALLADLCGSYPRERFLLVYALRERIPIELQDHPQGGKAHELRLSQRLQRRYGFSAEAAQWAVESWSLALNITAPAQDLTLNDNPSADVEEIMLQILEQEPLTSQEVATVLKTEQKLASAWLEQLQKAGKIERKWLKQRSPHYPCYQAVSAKERLSAEVAARKDLEKQVKAEATARQNAELRAKGAEAAASKKAEDRIAVEVASRRKAEKRATSAEEVARQKAQKRIAVEVAARQKVEQRVEVEVAARQKAEQQATTIGARTRSLAPAQRIPHRQSQPPNPRTSQQKKNARPSPSPSSSTPTKKQSSSRRSGCLWLLLGLLVPLGTLLEQIVQ